LRARRERFGKPHCLPVSRIIQSQFDCAGLEICRLGPEAQAIPLAAAHAYFADLAKHGVVVVAIAGEFRAIKPGTVATLAASVTSEPLADGRIASGLPKVRNTGMKLFAGEVSVGDQVCRNGATIHHRQQQCQQDQGFHVFLIGCW